MFGIAISKRKMIIVGILLAILSAVGYYIHTSVKIDDLQADKTKLTYQVNQANSAIKENVRRDEVVDTVHDIGNKERVIIEKHYQEKIKKVDKNVQEGKDKPVGPLLNEFFNSGL